MYDLSRLFDSPTKVIPSPELSEGVIMDLASNPHNIDLLIVATYGMYRKLVLNPSSLKLDLQAPCICGSL